MIGGIALASIVVIVSLTLILAELLTLLIPSTIVQI
jgi:hypothetical protein